MLHEIEGKIIRNHWAAEGHFADSGVLPDIVAAPTVTKKETEQKLPKLRSEQPGISFSAHFLEDFDNYNIVEKVQPFGLSRRLMVHGMPPTLSGNGPFFYYDGLDNSKEK